MMSAPDLSGIGTHGTARLAMWVWSTEFTWIRGSRGSSKPHSAVRAFVENKYLRERLSIRLVYEVLLRDLGAWSDLHKATELQYHLLLPATAAQAARAAIT